MSAPCYDPTPIQRLRDPMASANQVYMKRDDLLPFSFGGNKVRIADEFIADMHAQGATGLVMYGDRRSNLCRVLAMRCAQERIPAVMVSIDTGEEYANDSFNARIVSDFEISQVTCPANDVASGIDEAFALLRDRGYEPYYIYGSRLGTGNEGVAARAYAKAYEEICTWEREHDIKFDLIVLPYGTGSTQGGLVAGSLEHGDGREIVSISISSRTPERASAILHAAVCDYFEKSGRQIPEGVDEALHIEFAYNCGGYGRFDEEVEATIERVLHSDGIPLDPTYTGKAYRGMVRYLNSRGIMGKNVLFLHTGGLPLFFDYLSRRDGVAEALRR